MLNIMRSIRDATRSTRKWFRSSLPPWSRVELVMSGAFTPPGPKEFAHFGVDSWVLAPARLSGARHVWVGSGVLVMEHSEIRANPLPGTACLSPLVHLGDGTRLARFMTIWATAGVHFGERVSTSDNVAVVDCWYQPDAPQMGIPVPEGAPVFIGDGAYLGFGCVVGPGVTVGSGAFVGEGAVVLDDVPPHCVAYGNPARVSKRWTPHTGWQGDMFGETS